MFRIIHIFIIANLKITLSWSYVNNMTVTARCRVNCIHNGKYKIHNCFCEQIYRPTIYAEQSKCNLLLHVTTSDLKLNNSINFPSSILSIVLNRLFFNFTSWRYENNSNQFIIPYNVWPHAVEHVMISVLNNVYYVVFNVIIIFCKVNLPKIFLLCDLYM